MPVHNSDKVIILDLAPQIRASHLVYDNRFCRYLYPRLPDDTRGLDFFHSVKELHNKGITGAGVVAGIVDTGIMWEHPALRQRCVASKNFTDSRDDMDRHGHGTMVALLIQAIAPDVMFVSAKALDDQGIGHRKNLLEAMRWIGKQHTRVLNLSLGIAEDEPSSDCTCDICSEANQLVQNGVIVCAALGNDPSKSYHPASSSLVTTASVLGEKGFPSYISARIDERMRRPDITVPQLVIPTLGGPYDGATSMGTAYLTGIFTLLLQPILEYMLSSVDILPSHLEELGIPSEIISGSYVDIGVAAYRKGQVPEAINWYRLALSINPTSKDAHYNLGMAYVLAGDPGAAIKEFQWVLEQDPTDVDANINIGHAYDKLGEADKAICAFQKALELEPSSVLAMKNLANTMVKYGNIDDAKILLNQAVMIDPNNAEIHNDLGVLCEEGGRLGDALSHYEAAIRLAPYWELPKQNRNRVVKKI